MSESIEQLVSELPEVYQTIYGYPDLSHNASRVCTDRLEKIIKIYDTVASSVGRPLRVLDLGCAQGYFSLSLADRGAHVHGVDFLKENIVLCEALAKEKSNLVVTFERGHIEATIARLKDNQYDLVLGLSIFHHIVHQHGIKQVKQWISYIAKVTKVVVLELALRDEPVYWSTSQPKNPRELLINCPFVHELGRFKNHLSPVCRPLFVVSTQFWVLDQYAYRFDSWKKVPHQIVINAHQSTRCYFFSDQYFVKLYRFDNELEVRNRTELMREINFLSNPPNGLHTPKVLTSGLNENEGWIVSETLHGRLLSDFLQEKKVVDHFRVLQETLKQLVTLERAGLYHDDIRSWNVMFLEDGRIQLIDYGSISKTQEDCSWPNNIFLAFFMFVNELVTGQVANPSPLRQVTISPHNLPAPYSIWASKLWRTPKRNWSFSLMLDLLNKLPEFTHYQPEDRSIFLVWCKSIENGLQILNREAQYSSNKIYELEEKIYELEEKNKKFKKKFSWRITKLLRIFSTLLRRVE